jgi:Arc/MetJ family transcription regulator
MGSNVTVDEKLLEEVRTLTGLPDNSAAVEQILRRVLAGRRSNKDLLDLVGKIQFCEGYDPRSLRS